MFASFLTGLIIAGVILINTVGPYAKMTAIVIGLFFFDLYYLSLALYYQITLRNGQGASFLARNMTNTLMLFLGLLGAYGYGQNSYQGARLWFLLSIPVILFSKYFVYRLSIRIRVEG